MTRVCFVGSPDVTLRYELLSRETSREALSTYDLHQPFANSIAVRTVSLGAAISLCNDLQWYLVRFVDRVLIQEPSVSDDEWLSRDLATALRNGDLTPEETGEHLLIYGLEAPDAEPQTASADDTDANPASPAPDAMSAQTVSGGHEGTSSAPSDGGGADGTQQEQPPGETARSSEPPTLVDPLYVRRTDGEMPTYDLRDVEETLVVRLSEGEFLG